MSTDGHLVGSSRKRASPTPSNASSYSSSSTTSSFSSSCSLALPNTARGGSSAKRLRLSSWHHHVQQAAAVGDYNDDEQDEHPEQEATSLASVSSSPIEAGTPPGWSSLPADEKRKMVDWTRQSRQWAQSHREQLESNLYHQQQQQQLEIVSYASPGWSPIGSQPSPAATLTCTGEADLHSDRLDATRESHHSPGVYFQPVSTAASPSSPVQGSPYVRIRLQSTQGNLVPVELVAPLRALPSQASPPIPRHAVAKIEAVDEHPPSQPRNLPPPLPSSPKSQSTLLCSAKVEGQNKGLASEPSSSSAAARQTRTPSVRFAPARSASTTIAASSHRLGTRVSLSSHLFTAAMASAPASSASASTVASVWASTHPAPGHGATLSDPITAATAAVYNRRAASLSSFRSSPAGYPSLGSGPSTSTSGTMTMLVDASASVTALATRRTSTLINVLTSFDELLEQRSRLGDLAQSATELTNSMDALLAAQERRRRAAGASANR